ncbi:MAG: hypothetical protein VW835_04910 [Rickettsiales bacterium]
MPNDTPSYGALVDLLSGHGLVPRGGFYPAVEDDVPGLPATLVMVGNVGSTMWESFERLPSDVSDPLDQWSKSVLDAVAGEVGATALYPFGGPPYLPFQRWAQKAEPMSPSPLGILIHPEYGLWHAYRGALAFADELDLPPPDRRASPCNSCTGKPCLSACPVGAFGADGYDVPGCVSHLRTQAGEDCVRLGCRARRSCPVGRSYIYAPRQAAFHMHAFLRANG